MRFRKAQLSLSQRGMVLVEGNNRDDESASSNGTGKSTLVDAIVWCLYGVTTHEPHSAEGDDVVNETVGKNCEVSVELNASDRRYVVTRRRAWKRGGKAAQLQLQSGSDDMTKGVMRDTQDSIEKLIGMSVSTFRQSCVFGQGKAYRFSRLSDSDKKAVLDEMLGSEIYAIAAEKAGERAAQTERDLDKADGVLERACSALVDAKTHLAKIRAKAEHDELARQAEREELQRELATIEREWTKLGEPEDMAALRAEASYAKVEEAKVNRVIQEIRDVIVKARTNLDRLKAERSKLAKMEGAECLLCKQDVGSDHVHKQTEKLDAEIRKCDATISVQDERKRDGELRLRSVRERAASADEAIAEAKERSHARERLKDKLDAIQEKISRQDKTADWAGLIEEEKAQIRELVELRNSKRKLKVKHKRELAQLRFWQAGFGTKGLRSLLLDSVLPYLNAKLEVYSNALTAGNIAVEFRTQRELKGGGLKEDFHVHVSNAHGATKYYMNSVGERAKVDIVVGLALQDMAASRSRVPVNVAFFDEVFDGLDEKGIDRAVQVLSELKRESAFVITHNDGLKAFFQKRIVVVKEDGISRLEEH